jgi:hypothetical protein
MSPAIGLQLKNGPTCEREGWVRKTLQSSLSPCAIMVCFATGLQSSCKGLPGLQSFSMRALTDAVFRNVQWLLNFDQKHLKNCAQKHAKTSMNVEFRLIQLKCFNTNYLQ